MEPPTSPLLLASRKSELALWQAAEVTRLLHAGHPSLTIELRTEVSSGDVNTTAPLSSLATANPGVFSKELETLLLGGTAHLAVHSLKDMPTLLPPGLLLAGVTAREDPRDCILLPSSAGVEADALAVLAVLPPGALVGTSSLRREAGLKRACPHTVPTLIRGNLNTRLKKLDAPGEGSPAYSALVLAAAGVKRMGWAHRVSGYFSSTGWGHAVGQGALGLECRVDDAGSRALARSITHPRTGVCVSAERAFLTTLQGGCQAPIAVSCYTDEEGVEGWGGADPDTDRVVTLTLCGTVLSLDGGVEVTATASLPVQLWAGGASLTQAQLDGMAAAGVELGVRVAGRLLDAGGRDVLGDLSVRREATYGAAEAPLDR